MLRLMISLTTVMLLTIAVAATVVAEEPAGDRTAPSMEEFEQVADVFDAVPLFYLVNEQGSELAVRTEDGGVMIPVFLQPEGAARFGQLQLPSEEAARYRLSIMSLGQFYRHRIQLQEQRRDDAPRLMIIGDQRDISIAQQLTDDPSFNDVPVFAARQASTGGFITLDQGGTPVIPLFFEAGMLEATLQNLAESDQEMVQDMNIVVLPLGQIVSDIVTGSISAQQIQFVLPRNTMEFIRANQ